MESFIPLIPKNECFRQFVIGTTRHINQKIFRRSFVFYLLRLVNFFCAFVGGVRVWCRRLQHPHTHSGRAFQEVEVLSAHNRDANRHVSNERQRTRGSGRSKREVIHHSRTKVKDPKRTRKTTGRPRYNPHAFCIRNFLRRARAVTYRNYNKTARAPPLSTR